MQVNGLHGSDQLAASSSTRCVVQYMRGRNVQNASYQRQNASYQRCEHPGFPGFLCNVRVPWTIPSPVRSTS
eukprot:7428689-Pyramimonas_sp.AAC.1